MVALETLDTEGILLDCFEDDRLVRGLFAAGSGVLLLGTSSSGIISLLFCWLFDILYEMLEHLNQNCQHRSNDGMMKIKTEYRYCR